MTTTYSRALPEAMGYTVTMDDSAGYGVTRVLVRKPGAENLRTRAVWNPRDDSAQCFEVLCWLIICGMGNISKAGVTWAVVAGLRAGCSHHNNTPASLRAAIVEAAEMVANG